jgi:hypothetical protein
MLGKRYRILAKGQFRKGFMKIVIPFAQIKAYNSNPS